MDKQQKAVDSQRVIGRPKAHNYSRKSVILLVAASFLTGILWLVAVRFIVVNPEETHYHANFAVYINGQQVEFRDTTYYEEIAACSSEYENNPRGRVHMHEEVGDVIHIHDKRVTFGNFFQNIGWNVGDEVLETRDMVYQTAGDTKLSYILNGVAIERIDNKVIGNMDKLLVSFGETSDNALKEQYARASSTAEEVNKKQDPASCSGLNGAGHNSFKQRLMRATFWD